MKSDEVIKESKYTRLICQLAFILLNTEIMTGQNCKILMQNSPFIATIELD